MSLQHWRLRKCLYQYGTCGWRFDRRALCDVLSHDPTSNRQVRQTSEFHG